MASQITGGRRVLVTGGGTLLGDAIATALLAEGAEVSVFVRPGAEDRLGRLGEHVRWWTADVWDAASLRGRARGHQVVIHTVGSLSADPTQGLSYHRLNFVAARNITNMCISDGVPQLVLMSSARAVWLPPQYLASKRESEDYVRRVGVNATFIRAPLVYIRGEPRPLFFALMTALRLFPPFVFVGMRRAAPMPLDILARATARIALEPRPTKEIYYAPDLRRRLSRQESRQSNIMPPSGGNTTKTQPSRAAMQPTDDEIPFGWTPPR